MEMHEHPCQLDKGLVKGIQPLLSTLQPQIFQNIMGFKITTLVEGDEIAPIPGVPPATVGKGGGKSTHAFFFVAHQEPFLRRNRQNQFPFGGFLDNPPGLSQCPNMSNSPLGRGLGALLGGASSSKSSSETAASQTPISYAPLKADDGQAETDLSPKRLPIDHIKPCSFQPRRHFDEAALIELADSIREQGLIQPLVVRRRDDHWELIAGERRWRASQKAGLTDVPVVIREASDEEVLELALVENLQRENLNPMEEARALKRLQSEFDLSQQEVANSVGKSRPVIANLLRLLSLESGAAELLESGQIDAGHAKVLLALEGSQQVMAARKVAEAKLSVRQTESLVRAYKTPSKKLMKNKDPNIRILEQNLMEKIGMNVEIKNKKNNKGSIIFNYKELDQLNRIIESVKKNY
mgnify:CR=1 FL=1